MTLKSVTKLSSLNIERLFNKVIIAHNSGEVIIIIQNIQELKNYIQKVISHQLIN